MHHADIEAENMAASRDDGRRDRKSENKGVEGRQMQQSKPAARSVGSNNSRVSAKMAAGRVEDFTREKLSRSVGRQLRWKE